MWIITMKLLLVLTTFITCTLCASIQPRIILANGTALEGIEFIPILHGDPFELYCTGQGDELEMTRNDEQLPTISINRTTIKFIEEIPTRGFMEYKCQYIKSVITRQDYTQAFLVIDFLPTAEDFRCKSINLDYLKCSWTLPDYNPKYRLYYVTDGIPTLICKGNWYRHDEYNSCVWDDKHPLLPYQEEAEKLTFLMNTCNALGCTNQTFVLDHRAIVKLNPPLVALTSKSSHGAAFAWRILAHVFNFKDFHIEYRINYWYPGGHQIQVNTSTIRTNDEAGFITLELPCASEYYEVRFSVRAQLAKGEEYWSDEAVESFITDSEPENVQAVDPTCKRQKAKLTPDVMVYKTVELTEKIKEEQRELKKNITKLKMKASNVNTP